MKLKTNRNGNNKNGLGIIDLYQLSNRSRPLYFFTLWLINHNFIGLAKKILDIK